MSRKLNKLVFMLVLTIMVPLMLLSCDTGDNGASIPTYWYVEPDGDIETNDIQRLQEKVPFTIILPEYLPEEFVDYPPDLRYDEDILSPDEIDISIRYVTTKSPRDIYISEEYSPGTIWNMTPRPYTADCFLEISGVEVLERSTKTTVKIDEKTLQLSYSYEWLLDDVHFFVDIEGYDQSESRRIVESMFK